MLRTPPRTLIVLSSTTALTMSLLAAGTLPVGASPLPPQGENDTPTTASSLDGAIDRAHGQTEAATPTHAGILDGTDAEKTREKAPKADEVVTIIVQLDGTNAALPWYRKLFGASQEQRHSAVKDRAQDVARSLPATPDKTDAPLGNIEADYYHALDGFAITAPAAALDAIRQLPGVKTAFIEQVHYLPTPPNPGDQALLATPTPTLNGLNQAALAMTHSSNLKYTGEGQLIAVIDSGLDPDHPAFSGPLNAEKASLSREEQQSLAAQMHEGQSSVFLNTKVPFAYDYADHDSNVKPPATSDMSHGTHVAGIAAANADAIRGVAPDAQLAIFKVCEDFTGAIRDAALLAALDDALVLKPDVINMSLGSPAGFSDASSTVFSEVYTSIKNAGITLNAAAGNSGSSAQGNTSGKDLPYASDPDSSTVSQPATYPASLAVASVDNAVSLPYITVGERRITYVQAKGANGETLPQFMDLPDGTYPYVDAGNGSREAVSKLWETHPDGLAGSIAMIQRGGKDEEDKALTFQAKMQNIADFNPTAVIFYDNVESESRTNPAFTDDSRPAIMVTKVDGEFMLKQEDRQLVIRKDQVTSASTVTMSDFSSWGVSPDLQLKPEITAPGGSIYSSVVGGGYETMSGTSMASPQMAGITAVVRQRLAADPLFASLSPAERATLVTQMVMSTATPLRDHTTGAYYSPRRQGAGLANAEAATTSAVFATIDEAIDPSRPKAHLGDGNGPWTFTLTLHNRGAQDATYALNTEALSEKIADGFFQQHSENWAGRGIDITYGGDGAGGTVTVPASGRASVSVTLTVRDAFAQAAAQAPNGTFVDGFTVMSSQTPGAPDLSVPFVGFYGSWANLPVFDQPLSAGKNMAHVYASALANANSGLPLGINPMSTDLLPVQYPVPDPRKYVVSTAAWTNAPNAIVPVTGTLRSVPRLTYSYTNEAGQEVRRYEYTKASKSMLSPSGGDVLYVESRLGKPLFNGQDEQNNPLPEGVYTLTVSAEPEGAARGSQAGAPAATQTVSTPFTLDLTGPEITEVSVTGSTVDDKVVHLTVKDRTYLASIDFNDPTSGGYYFRKKIEDEPTETLADGSHVYRLDIPLAEVKGAWDAQVGTDFPATLPIHAWDYGLNASAKTDVIATVIPMTHISADRSNVELAPGQESDLVASHQPADANQTEKTWSSTNPAVVTVDEHGHLVAVAEGQSEIVIADAHNAAVETRIPVTVAPVSAEQGLVLSRETLQVETDGQASLRALTSASLTGAQISWTADRSLVTLTPSADGREVTVTAGSRSGDVMVKATVSEAGRTWEASARIQVRQADYKDFIIDENGVLQRYVGAASFVKIPENVTAIAEEAFAGKTMETVHVPATVTSIGDRAFTEAPRLRTVTFEDTDEHPSQLVSIGSQIISGNLKFDELILPRSVTELKDGALSNSAIKKVSLPDGVRELPANLLSGSAQLTDVTISDQVTSIGDSAFGAVGSLKEIKLRRADGSIHTGSLPESLVTIGNGAFSGTGIREFIFPAGVTSVGDDAFTASAAATVVFNDGLQHIGSRVVAGSQVRHLVVPDSVTTIGAAAFAYASSLESLHIGSGVTGELIQGIAMSTSLRTVTVDAANAHYMSVDNVIYSKDGTHLVAYPIARQPQDSYTVPEGVTRIDEAAFMGAKLEHVVFPDSLRVIAAEAFSGSNLVEINLPEAMETVEDKAFQSMGNLRRADLGGTQTVGKYAFDSDTNLTEVNMRPDLNRLVSLGENAFATVPFTELTFPDSLTTIGDMAFANNEALKKVHIGAGLTHLDTRVFTGDPNLETLTVAEGNPVYSVRDGIVYATRDDGLHLFLSLPTSQVEELVVAPGTVAIDSQALRGNAKLRKVVLPEGLTRIESGAFNQNSALEEVVFPDSLETVDGFYGTKISVADFGTKIKEIKSSAFMGKMPEYIIVRGGQAGASFADSMDFEDTKQKGAYFGEGIASVTYDNGRLPEVMVLPSTLETLELSAWAMDDAQKPAHRFYVNAEPGSALWNKVAEQLTKNGFDPATQLAQYHRFSVDLRPNDPSLPDFTPATAPAAGTSVDVAAVLTGGVLDPDRQQLRFVQVAPDGSETVLRDWRLARTLAAEFAAATPATPAAGGTQGLGVQGRSSLLSAGDVSSDTRTLSAHEGENATADSATLSAREREAVQPAEAALLATSAGAPRGDTFTWNIPSTGATLRVEARDATLLTVVDSLTVVGTEPTPEPTPQPSRTPEESPAPSGEPSVVPTAPSAQPGEGTQTAPGTGTESAGTEEPGSQPGSGNGQPSGGTEVSEQGSVAQGTGDAHRRGGAAVGKQVLSRTGSQAAVLSGLALAMLCVGGALIARRRREDSSSL